MGTAVDQPEQTREDARAGVPSSERWLLVAIGLGTTLAPVNSTMIAVALPNIQSDLGVSVPKPPGWSRSIWSPWRWGNRSADGSAIWPAGGGFICRFGLVRVGVGRLRARAESGGAGALSHDASHGRGTDLSERRGHGAPSGSPRAAGHGVRRGRHDDGDGCRNRSAAGRGAGACVRLARDLLGERPDVALALWLNARALPATPGSWSGRTASDWLGSLLFGLTWPHSLPSNHDPGASNSNIEPWPPPLGSVNASLSSSESPTSCTARPWSRPWRTRATAT